MWVLKRASRLSRCVPELSRPEHDRTYRHALDWLRVEFVGVEGPLAHWCHSWADYDDVSENSSDEDEAASDEDASSEYDSSDDEHLANYDAYMCYQCPYHPGRRHPSAELCRCWENMSPSERKAHRCRS